MLFRSHGEAILPVRISTFLIMKTCALATTIIIFFLIYWLLPNGKTPARTVLPAAIGLFSRREPRQTAAPASAVEAH